MSVYVKGMKMPKCCMECPCFYVIRPEYMVCELNRITDSRPHVMAFEEANTGRLDNCPLVEVPIDEAQSVEPEPLSDAYAKAVWTWLLDYQIKSAELQGRYTPYEVLSWVANDWRKEHEQ